MLARIIPSQTRRKILALFFQNPSEMYHMRRIGREVGEEINAVKRELGILEKEGLLNKESRVNKILYSLDTKYRFYDEFLRMFAKENELSKQIYKNVSKLGKLKFVAVSLKYAQKKPAKEGEIYVLFVGVVVIAEVAAILSEQEKTFGSEINYTVMTEDELKFRKKNNDPFIWQFLKEPKIMLVGVESELTT